MWAVGCHAVLCVITQARITLVLTGAAAWKLRMCASFLVGAGDHLLFSCQAMSQNPAAASDLPALLIKV